MCSSILDLPSLIKIKIISMLDKHSVIQVSQTCQTLRYLVELDHILALELPMDVQYEDTEWKRKTILRLKLNVKGPNLASCLYSLIPYNFELELNEVITILVELKNTEVSKLCINVNIDSHLVEPTTNDNYRRLLELVKKMHGLTKFKLTISGVSRDMLSMPHLLKISKDFMKCSNANHCILKLSTLLNLMSCTLDVHAGIRRLVVIGPCFGISTRRTFEFESTSNIRLKINNGICGVLLDGFS